MAIYIQDSSRQGWHVPPSHSNGDSSRRMLNSVSGSGLRRRPRANQTCPFLMLPYELRLNIYELLLASDENGAVFITLDRETSARRCQRHYYGSICNGPGNDQSALQQPLALIDEFAAALQMDPRSQCQLHNAPQNLMLASNKYSFQQRVPMPEQRTARHIHPAMSRICCQVYEEACALPYSLNMFTFNHTAELAVFLKTSQPLKLGRASSTQHCLCWR